jgi:hypothetical protein
MEVAPAGLFNELADHPLGAAVEIGKLDAHRPMTWLVLDWGDPDDGSIDVDCLIRPRALQVDAHLGLERDLAKALDPYPAATNVLGEAEAMATRQVLRVVLNTAHVGPAFMCSAIFASFFLSIPSPSRSQLIKRFREEGHCSACVIAVLGIR